MKRRDALKLVTLFETPAQNAGRVFTIWPAVKHPATGEWEPGGNWRQAGPYLVFDVTESAWKRVGLGRTRGAALHVESRFRRAAHARRTA